MLQGCFIKKKPSNTYTTDTPALSKKNLKNFFAQPCCVSDKGHCDRAVAMADEAKGVAGRPAWKQAA